MTLEPLKGVGETKSPDGTDILVLLLLCIKDPVNTPNSSNYVHFTNLVEDYVAFTSVLHSIIVIKITMNTVLETWQG